ncbi:hypothetical protein LOK74_11950 [Brevibacillus humidisoli]|uniref:hypothetical protein n=1 Tax=Brevibacillus humidisoli TaxID=2895522 RepID=UPI001E452CF9|nr:hypothetical protein [Brevibacillus humidisoli]UFJ43130.1 hypothetical protein LOK74_11950 [Brevibacillus humidisoli]
MTTCTIVMGEIPPDYQKDGVLVAIVERDQVTAELIDMCDEIYMFTDKRHVKDMLSNLKKYYTVARIVGSDDEATDSEQKCETSILDDR